MYRFAIVFLFLAGGEMGLVSELLNPNDYALQREQRGCGAYAPVPAEELHNETFVDSHSEAAQLVNNALLLQAQTRRIQQSMPSYFPTDSTGEDMVLEVEAYKTRNIRAIIPNGMLTGAGRKVSAWVYVKTDAANTTHLHLDCGRHAGVTEDIEDTSFGWVNVTCEQDPVLSVTLRKPQYLKLYVEAGSADVTVTVRSIAMHELGDSAAPDFIDTSGADNQLGQADFPYSAATSYILNNNIKACYGWRMPRANIINHCMMPGYKTTGGYDGDFRGLGMYIVRKSKGTTVIDGKAQIVYTGIGANTFRAGLYTTAGALVDTYTVAVPSPAAYVSWTFTGLASAETEYELRLDATIAATAVIIGNVFLSDDQDGSGSYLGDIPRKSEVQPEDDMLAKQWADVRDMLEHVWKRNRQILVNDYLYERSARDGNFQELLTEGLVFPSYNSRLLHFRIDLRKPTDQRTGMIAYDARAANFNDGTVVTGGTSGATGYLVYHTGDGTASGILYMRGISGAFIDNENLTDTGGGDATSNGIAESITGQEVKVKAMLIIDDLLPGYTDTSISEVEIDITDKPSEQLFTLDFLMPVPAEYWDDHSVATSTPLKFAILTRSWIDSVALTATYNDGNAIDFAQLVQSYVYEEI